MQFMIQAHISILRAVTRAFIGGEGVYLCIEVLTDEFLLKSVVIRVDFKRNSSHIANIQPPLN